jgi:hypothetical protein
VFVIFTAKAGTKFGRPTREGSNFGRYCHRRRWLWLPFPKVVVLVAYNAFGGVGVVTAAHEALWLWSTLFLEAAVCHYLRQWFATL